MSDRPTINISDLDRLREQTTRPAPLNNDEVGDYAAALLVVLRGLPRGDKTKVYRRLGKLLR